MMGIFTRVSSQMLELSSTLRSTEIQPQQLLMFTHLLMASVATIKESVEDSCFRTHPLLDVE